MNNYQENSDSPPQRRFYLTLPVSGSRTFRTYYTTTMQQEATVPQGSLETSPWPYIIYFSIALVATPVYIVIVVKLFLHRNLHRFSSVFYTLILSQGAADIFYIFCYTIFFGLSYLGTIEGINKFFRWTTANISYKSIYYCLSLRCVGVALISFQRYIIICRWHTKLCKIIAAAPRYAIIIGHWALSLILVIPILTIDSIRFGCVCKKLVAIDPDDLLLSTINSELIVIPTFLLCIIFYFRTLYYVYSQCEITRHIRSEIRLCVPVAALIFAFFLLFIYHLIQLTSLVIYHEQNRAVRVLEPLFSGFLSFFTPWMLLLSSREIASLFNLKSCKVNLPLEPIRTRWSISS
ncbi:hypothetical protein Y032_0038g3587 [Ancylostoma ceylanicum]|nr:hypothetical protein Y032_0038g3587 [Ancylostoma ceylanicum]